MENLKYFGLKNKKSTISGINDKHALVFRSLIIIIGGLVIVGVNGCNGPVIEKTVAAPVFYPPPPNQPKLQFLRSYSGGEDFGVAKTSFLEKFILGEPLMSSGAILKPYGVAIHDGKIYVCDVGHGQIKVMDLKENTFSGFPSGRQMPVPANIFIEPDGTKYIADAVGGAIFVYDNEDKLISILGKELGIKPKDVVVRGKNLYLTDSNSEQVLVLDKAKGKLLSRIGHKVTDEKKWAPDEFGFISDLDLDKEGNIYISDKLKSKVTKFDSSGQYMRTFGKFGTTYGSLIRAKGIALDREGRVWVVDAGPATAVKVFREDGQLLMYFGTLGKNPGQMYMPASVCIDYENVDYFRKYAVEGAELEFLILVTNQFGPHKISVYGFGKFPKAVLPQNELQTDDKTQTDIEPK